MTIQELEQSEYGPRFFSKVTKTGSCWLWKAGKRDGYGWFNNPQTGKNINAHRWLMIQLYGPPPANKETCHKCNIRECVNPDHLYYGTRSENIKDQVRAGTNNFIGHDRIGVNSPVAILTEDIVRAIRIMRKSGATYRAISEHLHLNINTVGNIINNNRYASVS